MKNILFTLFAGVFACQTFAQSLAHERCTAFGKGMNISNWLEASWQASFPTPNGYTKADFLKMKEAGIQSIRLPVVFAQTVDTLPPYSVNTNHLLFDRIDTVIGWCDELQLNLIIDNHHEWNITNENWRSKIEPFSHLWSVVAARYQYLDPQHYFFELLNEPSLSIDLDSLNILFNITIDSIRKHTVGHTIIVSPHIGSWGLAYANYVPLADTNLIYTFHCYDPINFTHQGFSWSNPVWPTGTPFPGSGIPEQFLYQSWDYVTQWRNQYNKPVFLGEFGVSEHADPESRCNWIEFFGHKIDSSGMNWFYWDWRWDFTLFQSHNISGDSIIPCFRRGLHLYGDTTTSGISQEINLKEISVYPNPFSGFIHIKSSSNLIKSVYLFNLTGSLVLQKENLSSSAIQLNLAGFPNGLYFLEIDAEGSVVRTKVVKSHF